MDNKNPKHGSGGGHHDVPPGLNQFFPIFFPNHVFPVFLWETLEQTLENLFRFGVHLRLNMFIGSRYIRRYPSVISARAFTAMTTGPTIMMTTFNNSSGSQSVCWACPLQPSPSPGPPAPSVANTTRHAIGQRPLMEFDGR